MLHCTQLFIINLPSSWYDWNTVEKDVKSQVIQPSIGSFFHKSGRFPRLSVYLPRRRSVISQDGVALPNWASLVRNEFAPRRANSFLYKWSPVLVRITSSESVAIQLVYQYYIWYYKKNTYIPFQSVEDSRVLQIAPTIYHQCQALTRLMSRYNWTDFSIVTTKISSGKDFISCMRDMVKRTSVTQGFTTKAK